MLFNETMFFFIKCMRLEGEVRICGSRKNDERYDWFSVGSRHNGKPVENGTVYV